MTASRLSRARFSHRLSCIRGNPGISLQSEAIGRSAVAIHVQRFRHPNWNPTSQCAFKRSVSASDQFSGAVTSTHGEM